MCGIIVKLNRMIPILTQLLNIKFKTLTKKGGLEGSFSNNFIYASHKFVVLFSLLFKSLLNHGYMPEQLLSSVIIPIPKNSKGNLSDLNYYHGIALSCA